MLNRFRALVPTTIFARYLLRISLVFVLVILSLVYIQILMNRKEKVESSNLKYRTKLNRSKLSLTVTRNLEEKKKSIGSVDTNQLVIHSTTKTTTKSAIINHNLIDQNPPFDPFNEFKNKHKVVPNNFLVPQVTDRFQVSQPFSKEQELKELAKLERIVHIDLKGAPPKMSYFEQFIPLLKENGATGVLLEYEDMFPYEGSLAQARHGNAYSLNDVKHLKELCKNNSLKIMPLVQTYGHLEWVLKLDKFKHLRDNSEYPQVITQCLNESYSLIFDMLDQVIDQHLDAPYFHIGCDEVYYKLMHPNCANTSFNFDFNEAFMSHLVKVAGHVKSKLPRAKIIFWHDMLNNMPSLIYEKYKDQIVKYELEPMIWAYVLNLKTWFMGDFFQNYGKNFPNIWAATAYKGAGGELATITNIQERNQNHITWIETILENHSKKVAKFRGIALTGWSRYDHFLALCELLPQAIPSLVFNLRTVVNGSLSTNSIDEINKYLGCYANVPWTIEEAENRYGTLTCSFPGNKIYSSVISFSSLIKNLQKDLEFAKKYMSPTNLLFNYIHKARGDEALSQLQVSYQQLATAIQMFKLEASKIYWDETVNEWLLVHVYPHIKVAYNMISAIVNHKPIQSWLPRPLNITLKDYPVMVDGAQNSRPGF